MERIYNRLATILNIGLTAIFNLLIGVFILFLVSIFCLSSYKIPTNSMSPALIAGDFVMASKFTLGARIFNVFASLRGEHVNIFRVPGGRTVKRNDVLVFNFPYVEGKKKMAMNLEKYYIKRCIGLPGDSLWIKNGFYRVSGVNEILGNINAQQILSLRSKSSFNTLLNAFPYDSRVKWDIKDFGPLYIPKKGDRITLNKTNMSLYKHLIEWESGYVLRVKNNIFYLGKNAISSYRFKENYYFMGGDNAFNSYDSRYWGLLPESFIAGKVFLIWKSKDKESNQLRWFRFMRQVK